MKNKIYLIVILTCISCNLSKNEKLDKNYNIVGNIKNLNDSTIISVSDLLSGTIIIDSIYSKNQKFVLNLKKSNSEELFLLKLRNKKDSIVFNMDFWNENKNILIEGDLSIKENIKIDNSTINDFLRDYRSIPNNYNNQLEKVFKTVKEPKKIQLFLEKFMDSIENDQISLLFTKPNTLFSISEILRYKHKLSSDRLRSYYQKLNDEIKMSSNGKLINEYLSSEQVVAGKKFINFTAKDTNGKKIKLSDFKGKIILLDFWAYWCTWCHVQNKEEFSYLNEKYKKDLVIISYSLDEDEKVWRKSIKKDSYKWINLSNLKGMNDPITYKYKINILPHSFIIDKNGMIVKDFIGYNRDSLIEKEIKKLIKL